MKDRIPLSNGKNNKIKLDLSNITTFDELKAANEAGTLKADVFANNDGTGTQEIGTALNKANLLSDATAVKYFASVTGTETVNQVLDLLSRFHAGMGNEYVWRATQDTSTLIFGATIETNFGNFINSSDGQAISYSAKVKGNPDGSVALVDPQTISYTFNTYQNVIDSIKGKYFKDQYTHANVWFMPEDTVVRTQHDTWYWVYFTASPVTCNFSEIASYVNSPDSAAYPPAVSDGYTYTPLGQIVDSGKNPGNFAPSGFGLGVTCVIAPGEDWNDAKVNGWYNGRLNSPDGAWWYGVTIMKSTSYGVQKVCRETSYGVMNAERCFINGVWQPWEWVNPAMLTGVEYRTTERYMGKPVYCKVVNCGEFATDKTVSWYDEVSEIAALVGINVATARTTFLDSYVSGSIIVLQGNDPWGGTVFACIKYTKTTN